MKSTHKLIILAVLSLIPFSGCSLTKGKGIAEAAVARFHDQYNNGRFHEIYIETDDGFKKVTSESEFTTLLDALRRKLGSVTTATQAGWGVNATPMGTVATLHFDVDFSEGKGTEQFVFHISGNKAMLYNYNVNSPLLLTR